MRARPFPMCATEDAATRRSGRSGDTRLRLKRVLKPFASSAAVFANEDVRRLQLAYGLSITAEWAATVALGVFAYEQGGTLAVGVVGLVRMLPSAAATPFAALAGDRFQRERVLYGIEVASAITLALMSVAFALGRNEVLVYAFAAGLAVFSTLLRPTLTALLPSVVRTPEELVASNGASLTMESIGTLVGPVLGGVVVATSDAGTAFAASAAAYAFAALLLEGLGIEGRLRTSGEAGVAAVRDELVAGVRAVVGKHGPRLVFGLFLAQSVARGAVNVFIVVVVFRLLEADAGWVGYLTAAIGAGGILGAVGSAGLTGRRLAVPFGAGLVLWGAPIALLAAWPNEAFALVLLALVGVGNSVEDVAGLTLIQRLVPDAMLSRVFGLLWGLATAGMAVGSIIVPALVATLGVRGALVAVGCSLPLLTLLSIRALLELDRSLSAPVEELASLERVPMFAPLSLAAKERLAGNLIPVDAPAGETIMRRGEVGDRFYIVVDGELEVATDTGRAVARAPDFVGEIALLRDVPRTATVTARVDSRLYALERDDFLAAVTGHAAGRAAGEAIVAARLGPTFRQ